MFHLVQCRNLIVSCLCVFLGFVSIQKAQADFFEPVNTLTEVSAADNVEGMTLSPDASHLYVGNSVVGAVSAFEFNDVTGALTYIDQYRDPLLKSVIAIEISPDGKHVYALSPEHRAIFVYGRDFITGTLVLNHRYEYKFDPKSSVVQFYNPWAMTFSTDGLQVYLASNGRISLLSRDSATGALSEQQELSHFSGNLGPEYNLGEASDILLSHDGENVYVTNVFQGAILIFARDNVTGELTVKDQLVHDEASYPYDFTQIPGLSAPRNMVLSGDDEFLYVVSLYSEGVLLSRDPDTGLLKFVETFTTGETNQGASDVIISNDNNYVVVSNHRHNRINVYSRNATTGQLSLLNSYYDNVGPFTNLLGIFPLIAAPGSNYILGAAFNEDTLNTFEIDNLGQLSQVELLHDKDIGVEGLDSVYASALSPNKKFLYTGSLIEGAITQFSIDDVTGALSYVDAYLDTSPDYSGLESITQMKIGPDNRFLYTVSLFTDGIGVFDIDDVTGRLTQTQFIPYPFDLAELIGAINIEFSPDGKFAYLIESRAHRVGVYARNPANGTLTFAQEMRSKPISDPCPWQTPTGLKFASNGQHAYFIVQGRIILMAYNSDTGALTCQISYQSSPFIPFANLVGIDRPVDMLFSQDESVVFVANSLGLGDGSITILSRDVVSGELSFETEYKAPATLDYGLGDLSGLYLSNDERYIYSRSMTSNYIAVHEYDATKQRLLFVEKKGQPNEYLIVQEAGMPSFSFNETQSMVYGINYPASSVMAFDISAQTDLLVNVESMTTPMYPQQSNSLVLSVTNQGLGNISSHSLYIDFPPGVTVIPDIGIQDICFVDTTHLQCQFGEIASLANLNIPLTLIFDTASMYAVDIYTYGSAFDTDLQNNRLNLNLVMDTSTPPLVGDDDVFAIEDELTVFDRLLSNDSDPDGDDLTLGLNQSSSEMGGSLRLAGNEITYVPPENYFGNDTFIYTASDGKGNFVSGTVSIVVSNINDNPQGVDDVRTTDSETSLLLNDLIANDVDVDTVDVLSIILVDSNSVAGGSVELINETTIRYTPPVTYIGNDQFMYTLSDNNGGLSTAQVSINVTPVSNDPVTPVSDDAVTTVSYTGSGGGSLNYLFLLVLLFAKLFIPNRLTQNN